MKLAGERVVLLPVPREVAVAVLADDGLDAALAGLGLHPARGWPHADTADALRPLAEHGSGQQATAGTFLITVGEAVVGECGWLRGPDPDGDTEVGFGVAPGARDRGLGTEAVAVLSAWVERQDGVRRVTAEVLVGNEPSHRLLTRLGFAPVGGVPPYVTYARDAAHVDRPSNSG